MLETLRQLSLGYYFLLILALGLLILVIPTSTTLQIVGGLKSYEVADKEKSKKIKLRFFFGISAALIFFYFNNNASLLQYAILEIITLFLVDQIFKL